MRRIYYCHRCHLFLSEIVSYLCARVKTTRNELKATKSVTDLLTVRTFVDGVRRADT